MSIVRTLLATYDAPGPGASTFSQSVTVPAGTTQLIVHVYNNGGRTVSDLKFNTSEQLVQFAATGALHANFKFEGWAIPSPTATTANVSLTMSAIGYVTMHIFAVSGSLTSAAFGSLAATSGTSTVTVSSAVGELPIIGVLATSGSPNTITDGSTPALTLIEKHASSAVLVGLYEGVGATSVTGTFTIANGGGTKIVYGYSIKPAASNTTFYLTDAYASGSNHGALQQDGSAPADAATFTGWTVAGRAVGDFARMAYNVERGAGTFSSTAQPSGAPNNAVETGAGDCFRIGPLSGTFPAGNWDFSFAVRADSLGGTQDGRMNVRVWRSVNADGSGATEITAGATALSTVTNLTTSASQNSTGTIALGAVSLTNEYLFIQLAWEVTGVA